MGTFEKIPEFKKKETAEKTPEIEQMNQFFVEEGKRIINALQTESPEINNLLKNKSEEESKKTIAEKTKDSDFLNKLKDRARTFLLGATLFLGPALVGAVEQEQKPENVVKDIQKIEELAKKVGQKHTRIFNTQNIETHRAFKEGADIEVSDFYLIVENYEGTGKDRKTTFLCDFEKDGKIDRMAITKGEMGLKERIDIEKLMLMLDPPSQKMMDFFMREGFEKLQALKPRVLYFDALEDVLLNFSSGETIKLSAAENQENRQKFQILAAENIEKARKLLESEEKETKKITREKEIKKIGKAN